MLDLPFHYRMLLLGAVLTAVSTVELLLRRGDAVRWRYSLFVGVSGGVGAAYGATHDAITCSLSPEYFAVLKGLGWNGVRGKAGLLGAQAGFSFGAIIATVIAYLNERKRALDEPLRLPALAAAWAYLLPAATLVATACGLCTYLGVSESTAAHWLPAVPFDEARSVCTVWFVHAGSYLGGTLGLILWVKSTLVRTKCREDSRTPLLSVNS